MKNLNARIESLEKKADRFGENDPCIVIDYAAGTTQEEMEQDIVKTLKLKKKDLRRWRQEKQEDGSWLWYSPNTTIEKIIDLLEEDNYESTAK